MRFVRSAFAAFSVSPCLRGGSCLLAGQPAPQPTHRRETSIMQGVLHQIISGIATGGIYASVALALVMIYQATHHVNFAQGEMATFSTYIALTFINMGMPYWVAFFLAVAVSFCIGVAIERILIRPMTNAPILSAIGVFVGLLLIIN